MHTRDTRTTGQASSALALTNGSGSCSLAAPRPANAARPHTQEGEMQRAGTLRAGPGWEREPGFRMPGLTWLPSEL